MSSVWRVVPGNPDDLPQVKEDGECMTVTVLLILDLIATVLGGLITVQTAAIMFLVCLGLGLMMGLAYVATKLGRR